MYYRVVGGRLTTPFVAPGRREPEVYVSGHSASAERVALSQGSCLLRVADAPEKLRATVEESRAHGVEVCLRMCVICRPTREEALTVAESLLPADREPGRLAYVTQTTLARQDADVVLTELDRRFGPLAASSSEDICYATTNRQQAVQAIAGDVDLVIVVGSCAGMAVLDDPLDRLHLTTPAAMLGSTGICASVVVRVGLSASGLVGRRSSRQARVPRDFRRRIDSMRERSGRACAAPSTSPIDPA